MFSHLAPRFPHILNQQTPGIVSLLRVRTRTL
jgi:hypothetical protein